MAAHSVGQMPRPLTWRAMVDLLETVDARLRDTLASPVRIAKPAQRELVAIVTLIEPVLIREGRRRPSGS